MPGHDVLVGDQDRHVRRSWQCLDASTVLGCDEDRTDLVRRLDQPLHSDQTLGDEQFVTFAPAPCRRVGEVDEVGKPLVVADR